MKLVSFGCSLIFGTDLSDTRGCADRASQLTWPALVAKKLNLPYQTWAHGGRGNLMIMDRLTGEIHRASDAQDDTLFVIQWTFIDRFDYCDPNGRLAGHRGNDYLALCPRDHTAESDFYYRTLHSEYRDKITNIGYIKNALDLLLEKRCRFVMTCVDDLIWCRRFHSSPALRHWQDQIGAHSTFFDGTNFLEWSRRQGFEISAQGHPLEPAHEAAAELMLPAIDAILHRA